MNSEDQKQDRLTLEMLSAIDSGPGISQRRLAKQMGVALGLANSYIKRCVRKGFIKINEAPANRYLYYLTPKGFREKSRITARFLSSSLDFYRTASVSCESIYTKCVEDGVLDLLLCGYSEMAEIAFLKSLDADVEIRGLFDDCYEKTTFFSRPAWQSLETAPDVPRLLTSVEGADKMLARLKKQNVNVPVYVPDVLGLSRDH